MTRAHDIGVDLKLRADIRFRASTVQEAFQRLLEITLQTGLGHSHMTVKGQSRLLGGDAAEGLLGSRAALCVTRQNVVVKDLATFGECTGLPSHFTLIGVLDQGRGTRIRRTQADLRVIELRSVTEPDIKRLDVLRLCATLQKTR